MVQNQSCKISCKIADLGPLKTPPRDRCHTRLEDGTYRTYRYGPQKMDSNNNNNKLTLDVVLMPDDDDACCCHCVMTTTS